MLFKVSDELETGERGGEGKRKIRWGRTQKTDQFMIFTFNITYPKSNFIPTNLFYQLFKIYVIIPMITIFHF